MSQFVRERRRYTRVKWDTGRGVSQLVREGRPYTRIKWDTGFS